MKSSKAGSYHLLSCIRFQFSFIVPNLKHVRIHSTQPYHSLSLRTFLSRISCPPDLGDRWINEKRKKNGQWYIWQTALRLVQGYGRSVRSKDDWAITYVLDSGFENFVKKNKNILPDWFTRAIQACCITLQENT
jgi:hypothetical protein